MYEPSRTFENFFIADFQHWDGASILSELKSGQKLRLVPEPDNPYDPDAVAICRKGTKLGYVPHKLNATIAQLLRFGHTDVFECLMLSVDEKAAPWNQVFVGVRIRDARK